MDEKNQKMNKAMFDRICRELTGGKSIRQICLEAWAPDKSYFYAWMSENADNEMHKTYQRAREYQAHTIMDDIPDWINNYDDNPHALTAKAKAAELYAKRCAPKKYGEKVEENEPGTAMALAQALKMLRGDRESGDADE